MTTFLEFLGPLKAKLSDLGPNTELCLTCGNESCDLDSIVSALVYAHYNATKTSSSEEVVHVPLLHCHKEDLFLREEVGLLFNKLKIDYVNLVFLDDISADNLTAIEKLSLVLVDHNAPTGVLEDFSSSVVKVIDHHNETVNSVANKTGVSTTIEKVGSCSTLVARELLDDDDYHMDVPVATLLLSAILLDTGNLKGEGRVTKTDEDAVNKLIKVLPSTFNQDMHYSELCRARFDVSKLSVKQALGKDYKECTVNRHTVGFSSVTALLEDYLSLFLSKDAVVSDFMEFQSDHKLDALIILGISIVDPLDTSLRRQIAVFGGESTSEFKEAIINVLAADEDLNCESVACPPEFDGVVFEQRNVSMYRKHIIPIVTSFISEFEYPRSGLSPSHEKLSSPTLLADESYPLEPSITILPSPADEMASPHVAQAVSQAPAPAPAPTASNEGRTTPIPIPEYTSAEESKERQSRRYFNVEGEEITINMDIIKPYRKIIQHAGYIGESKQALVVLSACYLPPRSLPNYNTVIHHIFYYILYTLDKLLVDDYIIVYLHSGAPQKSIPSIPVFHRFYKHIDRRLRKQLTKLYIVHPTFLVKTMIRLARPFISKKFWRKVQFIPTLQDLSTQVELDESYIPTPVADVNQHIMSQQPARQKYVTPQDSHTTATSQEDPKAKN